ncbi:Uma2 family endonuclease [Streptomyces sp. CA-253872]|uniref:Uma2 family endonuclease n=1 Tax=Streptomyces sp. CA-253872 TaxID=3240067 RepID=UPI003D8FFADB
MSEATSDYGRGIDAEQALKYAIQHVAGDRAEIVEGVITPVSPTWSHASAADEIREQIYAKVRELNCRVGSGDVDLPGSANWYIPDLAVVPRDVAKSADSLLPDQTLLVVEVTSPSNAETARVVKRRRYAEYGAPLYLLVDRQERSTTLFSEPGPLGYTRVEGPHPFGTPLPLPAPFGLVLETGEL